MDNKTENILRDKITITGDGNIIGNDNSVTILRMEAGNYAIQIGELHVVVDGRELYRILKPSRLDPMFLGGTFFIIAILIAVLVYLLLKYFPSTTDLRMQGEFNVAVSEFVVMDKDGRIISDDSGKALSDFLFQRLNVYFSEIDKKNVNYDIWSPIEVGKIQGSTSVERLKSAESLAQQIDADVIIYGVIVLDGNIGHFTPEFYVNYDGFEEGQELIGQHAIGNSLLVPLPFDNTQLQAVKNPPVASRVKALCLITIGLAYYSIDSFDNALDYFQKAELTEGWFDSDGKEVVYLLIGNSYIRKASLEKTVDYLPLAKEAYKKALSIAPDYIRARLGLSGVTYLEALGDVNDPLWETVDLDDLSEAEDILLGISIPENSPDEISFKAKIDFRLGHIYFARFEIIHGEWLNLSKNKFEQVIRAYNIDNPQIADLAGQSYAKLALIEWIENNPNEAIADYQKAITLVTPYYKAHYSALLGELYLSQGEIDLAIKSYEQAIQISEFYGNEEKVFQYQQRLVEIQK